MENKWNCEHKYKLIETIKLDHLNEIQHKKCLKCGDDVEVIVERRTKRR